MTHVTLVGVVLEASLYVQIHCKTWSLKHVCAKHLGIDGYLAEFRPLAIVFQKDQPKKKYVILDTIEYYRRAFYSLYSHECL